MYRTVQKPALTSHVCRIGRGDCPMRVPPMPSELQQTSQLHSRCRTTCSQVMHDSRQEPHKTISTSSPAVNRRQAILATTVLLQQLASQTLNCSAAQLEQQQQQQQIQQLLPLARIARKGLTTADIQADYDRYAASYDTLDGGAASGALGFTELRQQLLQQVSGDVLEVAVGTGLNLPFYNWSNVTSLTGIDLSEGMLTEAAARIQTAPSLQQTVLTGLVSKHTGSNPSSTSSSRQGVPIQLVQADAAGLPFPDDSFDVVVDTFSLCVFSRPAAALAEMTRVLRPGGQLLLVEHSRSDNLLLGAYMGATRGIVASLSKGCDWSQDVPSMVRQLPGIKLSSQQRHVAGTLVSIVAMKQA